ncbi:hypothetical protein ABO04_10640 [Nitrosomonas sp. HPC101]|uniref:hypothetical protein n=1 Tax=Nitrosomonas sp. HPC101 TaxID=1658667 RepID=UPI00136EFBDF|nr:hypothetical protein [Nitrosomonas sp. HPC101]MXS86335.1 hypothetical protein [Nitrosomonas sp. HPC101]
MSISNYALDKFVAQDMSKLTQLSIQSLAEEFPNADKWLEQFVLRRIFQAHVSDEKAALAFAIIRRTHASLQEWELASAAAQDDLRSIGTFFSVLRHLESCISSVWQGLEFVRKSLGENLFKNGDGSVYERMNWVYNVSRHFDPEALPQGDTHPVWLSDQAMHTREHAVSFDELREAIKMLAHVSEEVAGT